MLYYKAKSKAILVTGRGGLLGCETSKILLPRQSANRLSALRAG
jgi:hypothetical protein